MENYNTQEHDTSKINNFIVDNEMNRRAIITAIRLAKDSEIEPLLNAGLTHEIIERLKSLSLEEFEIVISYRQQLISVNFLVDAINILLGHVHNKMVTDSNIDKAIKLGARQPMLRKITGISRQEFIERCTSLNISRPRKGRISKLTVQEENRVFDAYYKYKDEKTLDQYCKISEETGLSIDRIWIALRDDKK